MTRVVLGWLSAGVLTLVMLVYGIDLLSYLRSPRTYTFGTEVAGLLYQSGAHFVGITLGTISLCAVGLAAPLLWKNRDTAMAARLLVAVVATVVVIVLAVVARSR